MKNKFKFAFISSSFFLFSLIFTGCYSVFSGGTGGLVVDSESVSTPKAGIPNVEVYAYTDCSERDRDFSNWKNSKKSVSFEPTVDYYGHTTTAPDGSWRISKLVWKENSFKTDFGKDADYTKIYLIFYHENYGCTKDETIIMSDSSSDTTYTELTSVVTTTALTVNFIDVSTNSPTNQPVICQVKVPQKTNQKTEAEDKVFSEIITGAGTITIRYPRYSDEENKVENQPEVKINYYQSRSKDAIEWAACKNNPENNDFSFYKNNLDDEVKFGPEEDGISVKIQNYVYSLELYGKAVKMRMPYFAGTYGDTKSESSDGVHLLLKGKDSDGNYSVDLGETYTSQQIVGTTGDNRIHGTFSGLGGSNYIWFDNDYIGRYAETSVQFQKDDGTVIKTLSVRSDLNYNNLVL